MSDVLDAVSPESRAVIVEELARRDPALLAELRATQEPSNDQSRAVADLLIHAMIKNFGPDQVPNERGKAIDNAVGAYFLAWPMYE